jgi:Rne/Rng family ribonuclease
MTRELFVSSTPHETKVGLVEDDQLAEIYLERENEYTLAGSIYKGRVTRVLPGMQSAFVDIGLERDAFLYVSDFMELENQEEDLDEIPTLPLAADLRQAEPQNGSADEQEQPESSVESQPALETSTSPRTNTGPREDRDRGGWRGRRRRRGGRDRDRERSSFRPAEPAQRSEAEFGPPAGYEPILLPGESISKYRNRTPAQAVQAASLHDPQAAYEAFPGDEPLFADSELGDEVEAPQSSAGARAELRFRDSAEHDEHSEPAGAAASVPQDEPLDQERQLNQERQDDPWDREQKRMHQVNIAQGFGGADAAPQDSPDPGSASELSTIRQQALRRTTEPGTLPGTSPGTMEEEEIDEEEAGVHAYGEDLEEEDEDEAFDEFEEETHAAGENLPHPAEEIAASADHDHPDVPYSPGKASEEDAGLASAEEEGDEESEEEAELEEAQAEAEALVAAEAVDDGTGEARVEVRAPAATAGYTQRARRPSFDRDRSRRGVRRGGGGRRFRRQEPQNLPQITDLLKEGQEILVQIAKEPIGKKGARITSHIALPGRFLVYMPTVNHTGVSRKIASEEERQRLKRIIMSERENGHGGFIVRTAAQNADEQELRADIRFLKGLWNEIRTRAESSKPPALIYHDLNVVERVLRDQVTSDFSAIWVDTEQEYERILRFANRFQPALVRRVKLYSKETPLFEQFGLKDELDKALKSKVWLKSGGYIVINQTEALVAIDVNTGKYVGKTTRLEDTIVKTNVDAIKEIVRQIRLRDLGGIIVIDFIDMDERRNRQKVMQALEEALRNDRAPSKVLQFNDFGLVAITRKRVKQSLERTIGSPCPYCEATGFVKNVNTVCNEIYIEMRKISKQLEHSDVMLRVNPEVAKALKTNSGRWLNELEELTKKTVIVKSDPALHQEQFDIN